MPYGVEDTAVAGLVESSEVVRVAHVGLLSWGCHGGVSPSVGKGARVGLRHGVSVGPASHVATGWRSYILGRKPCAIH